MKATFYLKDSKSKGIPTLIFLVCRWTNHGHKQQIKYSTKEFVAIDEWNATEKQMRRSGVSNEFNARLKRIITAAENVFRKFQNDNQNTNPTPDKFRELLDVAFGRNVIAPDNTPKMLPFFDWIEKHIEDCKEGRRLIKKTNKRFSDSSIKNYRTTLKNLRGFEKTLRHKITFESVTLHLYQKLLKYLNDQNFSTNHAGNTIKYLKVFMTQSLKDKQHNNKDFQDEDFTKPYEPSDNIYLNSTKLQKIYRLDLTDLPALDRVRDLFLIGCYTGLRYSDYSQLTADNVYNDGRLLKVKTQKTNKDVVIPLNPFVLTILEKYDGQIPKSISNQRTNDYLKDLGKLADLNDRVEIKQTKGGILITKFLAEWERITTHTGRRSFATNAYLNGVPTIDIMAITSHKTETSFMKYIKVTAEETAIRLLNHPHFNQMSVFKIA